jgi:hypothetical protein
MVHAGCYAGTLHYLKGYPSEVVEIALAHAVDSKVEAAYRRGDLFGKRRPLMAEWAKFCRHPREAKKINT